MARGGSNKKSIEEHIMNSTYRPSVHGYVLSENDYEKIEKANINLKKYFFDFSELLDIEDQKYRKVLCRVISSLNDLLFYSNQVITDKKKRQKICNEKESIINQFKQPS